LLAARSAGEPAADAPAGSTVAAMAIAAAAASVNRVRSMTVSFGSVVMAPQRDAAARRDGPSQEAGALALLFPTGL